MTGMTANILMLVVIFALFYVMLIKPQKKQQQQHQSMLNSLQVGDSVITIGGMRGVITHINDNVLKLQVAKGVEIEFLRSAIGRKDEMEAVEAK